MRRSTQLTIVSCCVVLELSAPVSSNSIWSNKKQTDDLHWTENNNNVKCHSSYRNVWILWCSDWIVNIWFYFYFLKSRYSCDTMDAIVVKYLQIFCIALLSGNIICDSLTLNTSIDDEKKLIREATCTATCLQRNLTAVRVF